MLNRLTLAQPRSLVTSASVLGLVYQAPVLVAGMAWPDLTLVRRRDRRLIFAALLPDGTAASLSPSKRLVMELLGSLQWDLGRGRASPGGARRGSPCALYPDLRVADVRFRRGQDR